MLGDSDNRDVKESRHIAFLILLLCVVLSGVLFFLLPSVSNIFETHFSPGIGLKQGAVLAFVLSIVVLLIFAIASGDGLLGEIQFILPAFFVFFVINWLLISWVF